MKQLRSYINIRRSQSTIKATDVTIKKIVKDELDKLGHDADLNHIDVSEVTTLSDLFSCLDSDYLGSKYKDLNPDISKWNVANVTHMMGTFYKCENFNSDLSKWDTGKVRFFNEVFSNCYKFNSDISGWDVSSALSMAYMFFDCKNFNQPLCDWDVSNTTNMESMFSNCESFLQDLSGWKLKEDTHISRGNMFDNTPMTKHKKYWAKFTI